ncbi:MAG: hypothetical protein Q4D92_08325 [Slackia sp.]|nr:hypothetical protein [Slackia sp.]
MADRNVESDAIGVPQLDETLEVLLLQAIEEAQQRMEDGEEVVPFTALLIGESVFEETHTGSTDECFESAQNTIEGAEGARAYAFCYDGYVETDDGDKDAIIAEGGLAGEGKGVAVGLLYTEGEAGIEFEEEVCYIAEAPNFLASKEPVSDIIEDDEE